MPGKRIIDIFPLIGWMAAVCLSACNNRQPSWSKSELDSFFVKVDSLNDQRGSRDEMIYIDSVYRTLLVVDDRMLFAKYSRGVTNRFSWGKNEESIRYSDSAIAIVNKYSYEPSWNDDYVNAYTSRGSVYFGTGRTDEALESYFLARERSRKIVCGPAAYPDHYIGIALYKQNKYASAGAFFKRAVRILDRCPRESMLKVNQKIELLNNISLCYRNLHQFDSAKLFTRKALTFLREARDHQLLGGDAKAMERRYTVKRAVITGNLGKLYELQGKADSAEFLYRESIRLTQHYHKEQAFVQMTRADLAGLYLARQLHGKAGPVLSALHTGLDSLPNKEAELAWLRLESQRLEQAAKPKEALRLNRRYYALRDSLDAVTKENTLSSMTDGLRRKSNELQISLLKKTNAIARIYLFVAGMLILFASVTLLLVIRNSRRTKRTMLELRRLNEQINSQKSELEQANREKERLMQVVAHDLRNPVGMASYTSENLLLNEGLDEQARKSLTRIRKASENALMIINELLGMKPAVNHAASTELSGLIASEIDLLLYKAREKKLEIKFQGGNRPIPVTVLPAELSRVFSNLLMNAIKFSPEGSVIHVNILADAGHALLTIDDEGIGMPGAGGVMVRQTGTAGERSYGMGLEIVSEILQRYGGEIRFESRAAGGTRVSVKLPLK